MGYFGDRFDNRDHMLYGRGCAVAGIFAVAGRVVVENSSKRIYMPADSTCHILFGIFGI